MEECRRMGISVLGPDVNESQLQFSVNKQGQIRFGLGAVKGVGEAAVEAIVNERKSERGPFMSIYDLMRRVNLRSANRKALESLAYAGAFDGFPKSHRAHYFHSAGEGKPTFMETLVRYGQQNQDGADSAQVNMFGEADDAAGIPEPTLPAIDPWSALEQLHYEKEVIGFYLSGHPLDDHRLEIKYLCNTTLPDLKDLDRLSGRDLTFAGIVTKAEHRIAKSGKPFGSLSLEDHHGTHEFMFFSEDYMKFKLYLQTGALLLVKGKAMARTWGRDEGQMELKVYNIDLLGDAREKYITKLNLIVDADRMSEASVKELGFLLQAAPGKCKVNVVLNSTSTNTTVEAASKVLQVTLTEELVRGLDGLAELKWTLN
jgi:DNA polymerase-3 subunit alpha